MERLWRALMQAELAIFAKAPIVGEVKTRMQPFLSAQEACNLHCSLVTFLVEALHEIEGLSRSLWVTEQHTFFDNIQARYAIDIRLQRGSDLGERMFNTANTLLGNNEACFLIGSDCAFIDADYLNSASEMLDSEEYDAVIGPAADGGYVLLGLKKTQPLLFQDINWGTERVFEQTMCRAQSLRWCVGQLPILNDIDRPEDLERLPSGLKSKLLF